MSPSSSVASTDTTSSIEIGQRRTGLTPSGSRGTTPYSYVNTRDYLHQPKPQQPPLLSRHYATLQEHADSIIRAEHADNDAVTPRHEGRRGSFAWGLRSAYEDEGPKHSRNPMMPQRTDNTTPPTMEELVCRNAADDDSSSIHKSGLVQSDAIFCRPSTTRSSASGTDINALTRTDTGGSIGGLARSMTKKIPDIRAHRPLVEKTPERTIFQHKEQLEDAPLAESDRKTRKLSFQLPSGLKMNGPLEVPQKPSPVIEESPVCESPDKATSPDSPPKCGGLAARRQVKMDLTLPIGLPDLSNCNDRRGTHPGLLSSITPSRPRSPKTPWIRETELNWGRDTKSKSAKTAPIVEEDQASVSAMEMMLLNDAGVELGIESALPPVTYPEFVRPPQKVRDRCYISRPTTKRKKSVGPSTSESDFGSTPDGHWTPEIMEGMTEQEAQAQTELVQLAKAAKTARSRRWPWNKSKASGSDEQTQTLDERSNSRKSTSVNIFKRSNRFPEFTEKDKKEKKPSKVMNTPWRREKVVNKPPLPSASLANMAVPPTFVPPGCEKIPTPPMFDSAGEVKGKLADFFFESGGFPTTRRKPKASPGGYWDSNAVLMSMQTDLGLTNDEDDEEGPEGRPPAAFHFGPVNDTPSHMTSPGLYTGPDGYLTVKATGAGQLTPGAQDSWFRMHFGHHTPDEESLTTASLKEADERRKFEWLIPEHLPNSPLCPLHVKYVGPSKGLCYWHGRKSNGWGVEPGRDYVSHPVRVGNGSRAGWDTGKAEGPKDETKSRRRRRRRLESLINP
ncbi:hypothetical protein BU25DRAFT_494187 [Macroventuria anomochaeta]|uniref:Uncharacterized protein n=1 Tax=Macroventuria anomochaeta TaxID=301207 RepID=A0ACB6RRH0_9PLEO|nr:uncharacterized protein BU25DRAFT_494187 [Macroventuria anomochaeta]KAF2623744.1 hypothetical protein BU25DRAFT_494187 [Macroventuria anomochaeta]